MSDVFRLVLPPSGNSGLSFMADDGVTAPQDYLRAPETSAVPVTFDRQTWDDSDDDSMVFLTYGTPEQAALLPALGGDDE